MHFKQLNEYCLQSSTKENFFEILYWHRTKICYNINIANNKTHLESGDNMRHKSEERFTAIRNFINSYTIEYGISPTTVQISEETGISRSAVGRYLLEMQEQGIITFYGKRGFVLNKFYDEKEDEFVNTPLYGNIACGSPMFADCTIEEYIKLPTAVFGNGDYFMIHAKGYSMIDAGISNGDIVVAKRQDYAENGQIVVALIDDNATLKRFFYDSKKQLVRLHPENPDMEDIYTPNCQIQGIAVKVIKSIV